MFDGPMGDLLKKAQEVSQNMQEKQEELAKKLIDVSVGGEMVKMTFNGKQEAISIQIDPEVIDPEDIDTLQDLILSAVNEGVRQSQKVVQEELGKQLGGLAGMNIPGINM
ncbi:MAG: YbaB/EbfC family nucleoid-associated protein [SAR324 cluster bacterium]|nr:YbaB/EbfC family nucleoid-associated protein [SAR324 cluster bacterium]